MLSLQPCKGPIYGSNKSVLKLFVFDRTVCKNEKKKKKKKKTFEKQQHKNKVIVHWTIL